MTYYYSMENKASIFGENRKKKLRITIVRKGLVYFKKIKTKTISNRL